MKSFACAIVADIVNIDDVENMNSDTLKKLLHEMRQLAINWIDVAAQNQRNADYYRGLVVEIGECFGKEAYISDDGSVQDSVLCAKVPELVKKHVNFRTEEHF